MLPIALPRQQLLRERAQLLSLYVHRLYCLLCPDPERIPLPLEPNTRLIYDSHLQNGDLFLPRIFQSVTSVNQSQREQ